MSVPSLIQAQQVSVPDETAGLTLQKDQVLLVFTKEQLRMLGRTLTEAAKQEDVEGPVDVAVAWSGKEEDPVCRIRLIGNYIQ